MDLNDTQHTQSYSDLAANYDSIRFQGKNGEFLYKIDQDIVRTLYCKTGAQRSLDIPVGTGRVLKYLADCTIVGVDYTPEMLKIAASVADPNRHSLMLGDAANLPFADCEFDCLISLRFFHLFHPSIRPIFVREFMRVVRPGGYLIVSFTNGWYGGGIGWIKRLIGQRTMYFEYPLEVRRLFKSCQIVKRVGNYLPLQHSLSNIPGLNSLLREGTKIFPLNLLCGERYYLLRKM